MLIWIEVRIQKYIDIGIDIGINIDIEVQISLLREVKQSTVTRICFWDHCFVSAVIAGGEKLKPQFE